MAKKDKKKKPKGESSKVWGVFSLVSALLAANIAKKGLNSGWKAATGKNPPENPADPDIDIAEAVLWAAFSGTLVAIARMLAQRKAAGYYAKSTGKLPPGLRADGEASKESTATV